MAYAISMQDVLEDIPAEAIEGISSAFKCSFDGEIVFSDDKLSVEKFVKSLLKEMMAGGPSIEQETEDSWLEQIVEVDEFTDID